MGIEHASRRLVHSLLLSIQTHQGFLAPLRCQMLCGCMKYIAGNA